MGFKSTNYKEEEVQLGHFCWDAFLRLHFVRTAGFFILAC